MQRDKGFDPAIADFAIVDRAHAPQISVARNPGERSVANGHAKTSHGASWEKVMGRARSLAASLVILAVLLLPACSSSVKVGPEAVAGLTPDGTIDMEEVQVAYLASGGGGNGTLFYKGNAYPFTIGGLGVGGVGASTISAAGEVYKLPVLAQFPGAYVQGRYGFALGNLSGGDLWLQNEAGVILHLKAKREGLMLSLGGDAIVISMR